MNKLKNKVLSYLKNTLGGNVLIDSETEISSKDIIKLALKINKKKIVNKKIVINLERSADYIGLIFALCRNFQMSLSSCFYFYEHVICVCWHELSLFFTAYLGHF